MDSFIGIAAILILVVAVVIVARIYGDKDFEKFCDDCKCKDQQNKDKDNIDPPFRDYF